MKSQWFFKSNKIINFSPPAFVLLKALANIWPESQCCGFNSLLSVWHPAVLNSKFQSGRGRQRLTPAKHHSDMFLLTADVLQAQNSEKQFSKSKQQFYYWVTNSHKHTRIHFQDGDVRMVVVHHLSRKAHESMDTKGKNKPKSKTTKKNPTKHHELRYLIRQELRKMEVLSSPTK